MRKEKRAGMTDRERQQLLRDGLPTFGAGARSLSTDTY